MSATHVTELIRVQPVDDRSRLVVERLLRERQEVWRQIKHEHRINDLIRRMVISSIVSLAGYGAILGISYGARQALSSAIKLPLLFLLTLAICLPTLYLFSLLYGGRLSPRQVVALALAAITVTAALTVAFAPISVFFLITARDYSFFKLLNVGILTMTGMAGLRFLVQGMLGMNALDQVAEPVEVEADDAPPPAPPAATPRPVSMPLLWVWLLLYGFVGTQLGWTLRPFFGSPELPFQIFRNLDGNFYTNILQTIAELVRGGF